MVLWFTCFEFIVLCMHICRYYFDFIDAWFLVGGWCLHCGLVVYLGAYLYLVCWILFDCGLICSLGLGVPWLLFCFADFCIAVSCVLGGLLYLMLAFV